MAEGSISPFLLTRGTEGLHCHQFDGSKLSPLKTVSSSRECRVTAFSHDGRWLAICDGQSVKVFDVGGAFDIVLEVAKPKARCLEFSPCGTYLAIWEPYVVLKGESGRPNLEVWRVGEEEGEKVAEFFQKKQQDWCPQWSQNEELCARNVSNEIHFFEGGQPGVSVSRRLQSQGLATYALSPGLPPYHVAIYVPGSKGAPSVVQLYQYPRLSAVVANKSFYKSDTVQLKWNEKGSGVLVIAATDVDKSGASYYGEQSLHYLSVRGDGNMVPLDKKGPVYAVEWSPNSTEFCVVYGFMPSKAALFNNKCEMSFDFGISHRNMAKFNPQGNIVCLAGFGNLRGNMEFWDSNNHKLISKAQASDSTAFEWCFDGVHLVTATTAPRLREGNGYKIWHFSGVQLHQTDTPPRNELWEVRWRPYPVGCFPTPDLTSRPPLMDVISQQQQSPSKPTAYVPPALRGKPRPVRTAQADDGLKLESADSKSDLSKSALKNKRKREAQKRSKQEQKGDPSPSSSSSRERDELLATAKYLLQDNKPPLPTTTQPLDTEKKLKNLRKKLRQIEQLKQQQSEGKILESNQLEKIATEQSLLEEMAKLEVKN